MKITEIGLLDLSILCSFNTTRYPFLFDSVVNNKLNCYSILFAFPEETIKYSHNNINFLYELEQGIKSRKKIKNTAKLPFLGGYFIYLSYEFSTNLEASLGFDTNEDLIAHSTYIPLAIIVNHCANKAYIIDTSDNYSKTKLVKKDIKKLTNNQPKFSTGFKLKVDDDQEFIDAINIAKQYIKAGDSFQINLSRKWQIELDNNISDIDIYRLLKDKNPAPFAAFANFDNFSIISSSPERLFNIANDVIQTRPIAGTRPRGVNDAQLKRELKNNLKERAEHLMMLDLERNDLGKVCEYGSIIVDETMIIESYEFVHHIVSNIKGRLKKDKSFTDIIHALFPGGTITGCPKIRTMQIINELEKSNRGAYTGSLGYISNCGNMDFNILIRTMVKKNKNISFRAGAGIVFDSIAERELVETNNKASGMLAVFNR